MNKAMGLLNNQYLWIAVTFLVYISWFINDEAIRVEKLWSLSLGLVLFLCTISFISFVIRFSRWHFLLTAAGYEMPLSWHLRCYLSGFAFTASPGKIGEAVRGIFLEQQKVPHSVSFGLFVCDRLCDLCVLVLFAVLFLSLEGILSIYYLLFVVVLVLLVPWFIRTSYIESMLAWLQANIKIKLILSVLIFVTGTVSALRQFLSFRRFLFCLVISTGAWSLIGLELKIVLSCFNYSLSFVDSMGITAVGLVAGALSLIPAGLGVNELVQVNLLLAKGVPAEIASPAVMITRICTLWFAITSGFVALFMVNNHNSNSYPGQESKV